MNLDASSIVKLTRDLCRFASGVVAEENEALFKRIERELPMAIHRFPSGASHNGWIVPRLWKVKKAVISRDGRKVFDGLSHTLGVGMQSKSFRGEMDLETLRSHVATSAEAPTAYLYHCIWLYRPWAADWAFSIPHEIFRTFEPGTYMIELETTYESGEMIVADYFLKGSSEETIVFNAHTCHPHQANDAMAGVALLIRLFQELRRRETHYSYRLVLGPEHLGTVFYLKERSREEIENFVCGVYAEMPGVDAPLRTASTFLGNQPIDLAFRNAVKHPRAGTLPGARRYEFVGWRQGVGNDETVWEAPGYEIPFVEFTRCWSQNQPYPEYHTSLDTPETLRGDLIEEFSAVLLDVVDILERNAVAVRRFDGLICLSNPQYDLYMERYDPAVPKLINEETEKWGHLLNSLLRYFDGATSIIEIAEKHDLPFAALRRYLDRFEEKKLVSLKFLSIPRQPVSRRE